MLNKTIYIMKTSHRMKLKVGWLLLCSPLLMLSCCAGLPGMVTDVSHDPRVAAYMQEAHQLTSTHDIVVEGRTPVLKRHSDAVSPQAGKSQRQVLPAKTRIKLTRIQRIQGDGFVLFRATGLAFTVDHPEGLRFTYKWGHGGMSPQAPWEAPGRRLKKQLGLE